MNTVAGAYPPPDEHVNYGERVSWFNVDDVLPHYDEVSPEHAHRATATMRNKEEGQPRLAPGFSSAFTGLASV